LPVAEDVCAPEGFTREVGATPAEFERGLRLALPDGVSSPRPLVLHADCHGVMLKVELTVMPERRIGLLRLPVSLARYHFTAGEREARLALLAHIDLAMQRGGG
jgi:hypothetical protein